MSVTGNGPSIGYEFQAKGVGSTRADLTTISGSFSTNDGNMEASLKLMDIKASVNTPKNSFEGGITGLEINTKDGITRNNLKQFSATHRLSGNTSINAEGSQYYIEGKLVKVGFKIGYDTKRGIKFIRSETCNYSKVI